MYDVFMRAFGKHDALSATALQVARDIAKQPPPPLAAPSLDLRAAVGPALARQLPATAEVHWKLMVLHYDGPEHADAVFRLRDELSRRWHSVHFNKDRAVLIMLLGSHVTGCTC